MGFFKSLFGGGGSAPQVQKPVYDAEGIGLTGMKKQLANSVNQQRNLSNSFGAMIPGFMSALGEAPKWGQFENDTYTAAGETFAEQLRMARLNAFNIAGNSIGGDMSTLAGKGISTMGAGAANIKAGTLAKVQTSLNETAAAQAMKLMDLRNTLSENVYNRIASQASFLTAAQGTADQQASANLGTLLGENASRMKLESDIGSYNAQLSLANKASKRSLLGGMFGSALGLGGSFISGFGGGK